jgi:N-acetylmuramoyl-L-alanine amidase
MRTLSLVLGVLALAVCVSTPAQTQQKSTKAREQFERAVGLRTALESGAPADRTVGAYNQAILAFKKVYTISAQAEEVTPSLVAVAELYAEMGRQYDGDYFKSAIDGYNFLLKQYPHSRYAVSSLFAIGKIQQDDLKNLDAAEITFKSVMQRFPQSPKAGEAGAALKQIAQVRDDATQRAAAATSADDGSGVPNFPAAAPLNPKSGGKQAGVAQVSAVRTWNSENYTRVVVDLGDSVKFEAARIANPDRIFFDLYQAKIDPSMQNRAFDVKSGFLKSVRLAQNKLGVVRIVLDVDGALEYSAYLLKSPPRLVIDVHGDAYDRQAAAARTVAAVEPKSKPVVADADALPAASAPPSGRAPKVGPTQPGGLPSGKSAAASNSLPDPVDNLPVHQPSSRGKAVASLAPPPASKPTHDGQRSLTRALGLKISRVVIDAGHGGHDTGTIGPHGLMEKDLCLDVALRLGKLIQERLPGAEVIYTRRDDTFIPLEERTAIANQVKADLFISIHANSSHDSDARGVETYYLNFASSQDALDVAARENALSQSGLHDLQDMIKKIARNEKVEESKELADDIQGSLLKRLQQVSRSERDRGVKRAPFVVLIGANMPSILSEISFLSNPADEKMLKKPEQRQRIAEGLYHGMSDYLESLNSLSYNSQRAAPHASAAVESTGNSQ